MITIQGGLRRSRLSESKALGMKFAHCAEVLK
jgi:hypothetical protein